MIDAADLTFLIVIEANRLEPQALLLCESIRTFAGRYANCPIVAVSPRSELGIGDRTRRRLSELAVRYVAEPLNRTGSPYGSINRIVAGAWAERCLPAQFLVVLDTDMLMLSEPCFEVADAGVRPVDAKGSASSGADDPQDAYWRAICGLADVSPDDLPYVTTTIDRVKIRASYNGGFAVVRRACGILGKTEAVFFASSEAGLRPLEGRNLNIRASTGFVGAEASEWWGSSQAALSAAIWASTTDVRVYDDRYNIPLHLLKTRTHDWPLQAGAHPVLVHYHHLCEEAHRPELADALRDVNCSSGVLDWIQPRLAIFDEAGWPAVPTLPETGA